MAIDIESLGFTKEELQQRVIEACVERVLETRSFDDDGSFMDSSPMAKRLEKAVKDMVDRKVSEIAEKHILPLTATFIENLTLQSTNQWGEKTGERLTFVEYLVKRAENYLREDVNYEGKDKSQANGYGWTKAQSRISHMVNAHLHYAIETAMKSAVANANAVIVGGIEETVKFKLGEIAKALKVTVTPKN